MLNNNSNNSCLICRDSISDPVCKSCYIKQIESKLNDLNLHPLAKEVILTKIKRDFPIDSPNDTSCVLCHKESVVLCRYCFSVLINRILGELNFSNKFIENFGFSLMAEEVFSV